MSFSQHLICFAWCGSSLGILLSFPHLIQWNLSFLSRCSILFNIKMTFLIDHRFCTIHLHVFCKICNYRGFAFFVFVALLVVGTLQALPTYYELVNSTSEVQTKTNKSNSVSGINRASNAACTVLSVGRLVGEGGGLNGILSVLLRDSLESAKIYRYE